MHWESRVAHLNINVVHSFHLIACANQTLALQKIILVHRKNNIFTVNKHKIVHTKGNIVHLSIFIAHWIYILVHKQFGLVHIKDIQKKRASYQQIWNFDTFFRYPFGSFVKTSLNRRNFIKAVSFHDFSFTFQPYHH